MATTDDQFNTALRLVEDLLPRLDSLSDPDCVEGIALRFDALKRLLVSVGIDEATLYLVDMICRSLNQCNERYGASSNNSSFPERLHTGCRGKPSYQINEEKLNFLLEQGFKVAEVSEMLGVSKRTVERRMRLFGLSVSGTVFFFNRFYRLFSFNQ